MNIKSDKFLSIDNRFKYSISPSNDIKNFILLVNNELIKTQQIKRKFLVKEDISIYQIVIQDEKAKIYLELLTEIRNKALEAYKAIMNMQL